MSLTSYLQVGLVAFVLIIGALGYLGWRKTSTMGDFAIGGARLGPYVLGGAMAATTLSAATFVGYVGWSYAWGLSNLWVFIAIAIAIPIVLVLIAKRVREANIEQDSYSLPDWLGDFYNSDILRVLAAGAVMFNIFYIAAQLIGGALIFELLLNWEFSNGLIVTTIFVTVYVFVGGTFADVYTDFAQAILMAGMGAIVFISGFWVFDQGLLGTLPYVVGQMESQSANLVAVTNPESAVYYSAIALAGMFIMLAAFPVQPQLFNKILALENPKELTKMTVTFVTFLLLFLLTIFGGFYMFALDPTLSSPDNAIFIYTQQAFPTIMTALLGLVILAAALSTTDGLFVVLATAVANDIFLKTIVENGYVELEEERADTISRYIAQGMVIVVGLLAYLIATANLPISLGELVWVGISGVAAATVGPVLFGIYYPNFVTEKAAIASMVIGMSSYLVYGFMMDIRSVLVAGAAALISGIIAMLVVSAITDEDQVQVGPSGSKATHED